MLVQVAVKNSEVDFEDIIEELNEASVKFQGLIDDFSKWEGYWCDGECCQDEYEKAKSDRMDKLKKLILHLAIDTGVYCQILASR